MISATAMLTASCPGTFIVYRRERNRDAVARATLTEELGRLNMPAFILFMNEVIGPTQSKYTINIHVKVGAGVAPGAF